MTANIQEVTRWKFNVTTSGPVSWLFWFYTKKDDDQTDIRRYTDEEAINEFRDRWRNYQNTTQGDKKKMSLGNRKESERMC